VSRALAWDGCVNVRDLGGLPTEDGGATRFGSVVRGDRPSRLTEDGWRALAAHGIRRVLDLRAAEELGDEPPPRAAVDVVRVPLMGEEDAAYLRELADRRATFAEWYVDTLDRHRGLVARALAAVADAPEGGVLVHCHGGRDRTGIVCALLLRLAGVADDAIADDYAVGAPREAMLGVLAELDRRWGGAEEYLREAGLDDAQLARLRERLR
jgi:hypothetical protein